MRKFNHFDITLNVIYITTQLSLFGFVVLTIIEKY